MSGPTTTPGCNYQGYEFGAGSYPDSVCIEGRLHDADAYDSEIGYLAQDEDIPCPMCRTREATAYHARRNLSGGDSFGRAWADARALVRDIRRNRGVS